MANRTVGDFTRSRLALPTVSPNLSGSKLLKNVSRSLDRLGQDALKQWEDAEVLQATKDGEADGSTNSVQYREGDSLSAQAYKEAADRTRLNLMVVENASAFNQLSMDNPADPAAYLVKSNDFIEAQVDKLSGNEPAQALMEANMKLRQQADGYKITKAYNAIEIEKFKVSTDTLVHTIKTSTYENAGEIFSKDANSQALALNTFGVAKKTLTASLNAVTPAGLPVYSGAEKEKIMNGFHEDFYARAAQDYFQSNDPSPEELSNMIDGKLEISIPGTDQKINVLNEVGVEKYETKVRDKAVASINARNVQDRIDLKASNAIVKENQAIISFSTMSNIMTGNRQGVTVTTINNMVDTGSVTGAQGQKLLTALQKPSLSDDPFLVANINNMIINGQDATQEINEAGLSSKTYISLSKANATALNTATEGIDKENKRMIRDESSEKEFGSFTAASATTSNSILAIYDKNVQEGMNPDLALEKARVLIKAGKDREIKRYDIHLKMKDDRSGVDPKASNEAMLRALDEGTMSKTEYNQALNNLLKLTGQE